MLDDTAFGKRDARGNWAPNDRVSYGPFFSWPIRPRILLTWFFGYPGYLFPWNVLYAVGAVLILLTTSLGLALELRRQMNVAIDSPYAGVWADSQNGPILNRSSRGPRRRMATFYPPTLSNPWFRFSQGGRSPEAST